MTYLEGAVKECEGVTIGKYRHPRRFPRRNQLSDGTLGGDDRDRQSTVTRADWRWELAHWPHERWSRWRRYVGEFASLDGPPTVEVIHGAEAAAYDLLR